MKEKKSKMTIEDLAKSIEDLAAMTQRGFTEQAKRSDNLEVGQKRLEDNQEKLGQKQEIFAYSLTDIRKEIAQLTHLIEKSSNRVEINELKKRVSWLEVQLAKGN
jgi:hypothetical protein